MAQNVTAYDLLISCPSDVSEHIPKIEQAVDLFNNIYGRYNNIIVRTLHWSKSVPPSMEGLAQDIINEVIVSSADMVVGIFGNRFGTPTEKYGSGTEEEIVHMTKKGKKVFLYFLDVNGSLKDIDYAQYEKVQEFKKRCTGLYNECSIEMFERKFLGHLLLHFNIKKAACDSRFREGSSKSKILWVDDRPEFNVYERRELEYYGLDFTLSLSTQQALSELRKDKFSLIISDMGRREGFEEGYKLLKEVRKFDQKIPFIIYTGYTKVEHITKVINCGGQGYTNDPMELVDLVLTNLLRNK